MSPLFAVHPLRSQTAIEAVGLGERWTPPGRVVQPIGDVHEAGGQPQDMGAVAGREVPFDMRPIQRCPQALAKRSLTPWISATLTRSLMTRADECRPSSLGQNGTTKAEWFAVCGWTQACLDVDWATMTTAELTAQRGVFGRPAAVPVVDRLHGLRGMSFVAHALSLYRRPRQWVREPFNPFDDAAASDALISHRTFSVRTEVAAVGAAICRRRLETGRLVR